MWVNVWYAGRPLQPGGRRPRRWRGVDGADAGLCPGPEKCKVWHAAAGRTHNAAALDLRYVYSPLPDLPVLPNRMSLTDQVLAVLDEVLSLNGRSATFGPDTHLRGAVPELDSMAVVSMITALEDTFGIVVDDDDIDGATFATVGTLVDFVSGKLTV